MISILLLSLLSQTPVRVMNNKADAVSIATRCVNAAGTAFVACGTGTAAQGVNNVDGGTRWQVFDPTAALNELSVNIGTVPGARVDQVFGRNLDIDTATVPEDVWNAGGPYTGFPMAGADGGCTGETVQAFSASASDTAAGVGARTVKLTGLDVNYLEQTETIALNGVTPVNGVLVFCRVRRLEVRTSGSSIFNVGEITVRHTTTVANIFVYVPVGTNRSYAAVYTVPAGVNGYLSDVGIQMLGGATAAIRTSFWIREYGFAPALRRPYDISDQYPISDTLRFGMLLPEKTDVTLRVLYSASNNVVLNTNYVVVLVAP